MSLWVSMEDVLSITFLIPKEKPRDLQLVGFHLSLPMEYVDNAPYFCMSTEMVANFAKKAIAQQDVASAHLLEQAAEARAADNSGAPEAKDDAS